MRYLLDSVILIDHFNGIELASDFIRKFGPLSDISAITRAEVMTGFTAQQIKKPKLLLDTFNTITISKEIADLAAILRRKHRWKLPDALQAAVATDFNLKLVTRNTKDFSEKKHSFVLIPYKL